MTFQSEEKKKGDLILELTYKHNENTGFHLLEPKIQDVGSMIQEAT